MDAIAEQVGVPEHRRAAELSKAQRRRLVQAVKQLPIPISGTLGFKKAEVTAGGVALEQIDSRTMQSKIVPNLYIAGELLDLDGPIGGYNFQVAFSTGWLVGESS
jgi:predicted Rossmann fold flavoprotein